MPSLGFQKKQNAHFLPRVLRARSVVGRFTAVAGLVAALDSSVKASIFAWLSLISSLADFGSVADFYFDSTAAAFGFESAAALAFYSAGAFGFGSAADAFGFGSAAGFYLGAGCSAAALGYALPAFLLLDWDILANISSVLRRRSSTSLSSLSFAC